MKQTSQRPSSPTTSEPSRFAARHDVSSPADERAGQVVVPVAVAERQDTKPRRRASLALPRWLVDGPVGALWGTALVAGYLVAAYWAVHQLLPSRLSPDLYVYVVQPLIWGGLGLLAFALWQWLPDRPRVKFVFVGLAVVAGVFQISLLIIAGMLYGFGSTPYGDQAISIAKNALYLSTLLLGLEMSRAYLLSAWSRINPLAAFAVVAALYAAVAVPLGQFRQIGGRSDDTFEVTGATLLPAASESVMATFLAVIGGPLPAFAYRFTVEGFEWFSPILPSLNWPIIAFLGTLTPILALLFVRDIYFSDQEDTEGGEEQGIGVSPFMLLAGIAIVGLIWLNAGMFGVQPALISGVSMKPELGPGDVVFTKQVAPESLEVGDIVRYERNGIPVMHRIVEIAEHIEGPYYQTQDGPVTLSDDESGPVFIIRGDGNNTPDPPVFAGQIEGKVVFTLPYAGWIPIGIKKVINVAR